MPDPSDAFPQRPPRRWVVPPGLVAHDEPYDGFHLLDELRTGLGLLLWQVARDADLWATAPPEARPRLFHPSARARRRRWLDETVGGTPLHRPLATLLRRLEGRPTPGDDEVVEACQAITRWATERGYARTALAYAQTAALNAPDRPQPAHQVGLLARRGADYRRAETWFRRALGLARREKDWRIYGMSCIGLGNLFLQRGDYPTARTWFIKALRITRRHGLWVVRPMALHDLFCVAANRGEQAEAELFARRAFRAYGRRHPRLLVLAHDVARFWLMRGDYARSLQVFRAVVRHIERPPERRLAASNMAVAAAGVGDRLTFAAMWSEVWRLVDDSDDAENTAQALVTLAQGAAALGDPDRAQMAAHHALKVAIQRNESEQRIAAETILEKLRLPRAAFLPRPRPEEPPGNTSADALAADLVDALTYDSAEP